MQPPCAFMALLCIFRELHLFKCTSHVSSSFFQAGMFQSEYGKAACRKCSKGSYRATTGASSCSPCPIGRAIDVESATACNLCPKGRHQQAFGAVECMDCAAGRYQKREQMAFCDACAEGYWSDLGQSRCLMCAEGYWYRSYYDAVAKFAENDASSDSQFTNDNDIGLADDDELSNQFSAGCVSCGLPKITGVYCGGGLCLPVPQRGHWSQGVDGSSDDLNVVGSFIYVCRSKGCTGAPTLEEGCYSDWHIESYPDLSEANSRRLELYAWEDAENLHRDSVVVDVISSSGRALLNTNETNLTTVYTGIGRTVSSPPLDKAETCAPGAYGPLCQACQEGWFFDASDEVTCKECTSDSSLSALPGFLVLIALVLMVRSGGVLPLPAVVKEKLKLKEDLHLPVLAALRHVPVGQLKVVWSTFQIVHAVCTNLELSFPEPMLTFNMVMSVLNLDFLNVDCSSSGANFHSNVYSITFFPLLLMGCIWLAYWIERGAHALQANHGITFTKKQKNDFLKRTFDVYFNRTLIATYLFLPTVTLLQFKGMKCFSYEASNESFLKADSSIICNSDEHQSFIVINALMVTFYQGVVLLYVYLLYSNLDKISPVSKVNGDTAAALQIRDLDRSLDHIRFLFDDTRISCWYHEILDMYRRIFLIGLLPLTSDEPVTKAYIGAGVAMVMMVYFRETMPSRNPFTNLLAVLAQYQILFVFLAALFMITAAIGTIQVSDLALGCLLVLVNLIVVAGVIYAGWITYSVVPKVTKRRERKVAQIEYAALFEDEEFEYALQSVSENLASQSSVLVYHYTSMAAAKQYVESGIPAFSATSFNCWSAGHVHKCQGVAFSLKGPHQLKHGDPCLEKMSPVSACREAVLCVALPSQILWPVVEPSVYGNENDDSADASAAPDLAAIAESNVETMGDEEMAIKAAQIEALSHLVVVPSELLTAFGRSGLDEGEVAIELKRWGVKTSQLKASAARARARAKLGISVTATPKQSISGHASGAGTPAFDRSFSFSSMRSLSFSDGLLPRSRFDAISARSASTLKRSDSTQSSGKRTPVLQRSFSRMRSLSFSKWRKAEVVNIDVLETEDATDVDEMSVMSDVAQVSPEKVTEGGAPAEAISDHHEHPEAHGVDKSLGTGAYLSGDLDGDAVPDFPPVAVKGENIVKAYQLVPEAELNGDLKCALMDFLCPEVLSDLTSFISQYDRGVKRHADKASTGSSSKVRIPVEVPTCEEYLNRMAEVRYECAKRGLVPVYYYTLPHAANMISHNGFRTTSSSSKNGGVCFSALSPASYDLGCSEYEANLIADLEGPDKVDEMSGAHKFDLCFVYAAEPRMLRRACEGRDTVKIIPHNFFETFAEQGPKSSKDSFWLRPDRIVASFKLDPTQPPKHYVLNIGGMQAEKEMDKILMRKLAAVDAVLQYNESVSRGEHGLSEGQYPWPRMDLVLKGANDENSIAFGSMVETSPVIFLSGDFGIRDWNAELVDFSQAGASVHSRDLPQTPKFADDNDPELLVGLNVHLKDLPGPKLSAINNWTGIVMAWKSGDGFKDANTFIVELDSGLPGFAPYFEFACEGRHIDLAEEQGEGNKPLPRALALLANAPASTELEFDVQRRRETMRYRHSQRDVATPHDSATAIARALEDKAKDTRQRIRHMLEEVEAKKRKSQAAKQLKEEELQRVKEQKWIEDEVRRKLESIKAARKEKAKARDRAKLEEAVRQAKARRMLQDRLGPQLVAAAERILLKLDKALSKYRKEVRRDAWSKWTAFVLASRATERVLINLDTALSAYRLKICNDAWGKWAAFVILDRAEALRIAYEAQVQLDEDIQEARRQLDEYRLVDYELRLQGDDDAIAEFESRVSVLILRESIPTLVKSWYAYRQRLSFERWKAATVAHLEAEVWASCVADFTRKKGFPPKPGCLWVLSPESANLLGEPIPDHFSTTGGTIDEADDGATSKAQRAMKRDARKLAKIRDKLEGKEPPTGLLEEFVDAVLLGENWRAHVEIVLGDAARDSPGTSADVMEFEPSEIGETESGTESKGPE